MRAPTFVNFWQLRKSLDLYLQETSGMQYNDRKAKQIHLVFLRHLLDKTNAKRAIFLRLI